MARQRLTWNEFVWRSALCTALVTAWSSFSHEALPSVNPFGHFSATEMKSRTRSCDQNLAPGPVGWKTPKIPIHRIDTINDHPRVNAPSYGLAGRGRPRCTWSAERDLVSKRVDLRGVACPSPRRRPLIARGDFPLVQGASSHGRSRIVGSVRPERPARPSGSSGDAVETLMIAMNWIWIFAISHLCPLQHDLVVIPSGTTLRGVAAAKGVRSIPQGGFSRKIRLFPRSSP